MLSAKIPWPDVAEHCHRECVIDAEENCIDEHTGNTCVYIKDTGHGIEKKNLSRIFDPFFTTKPTGEGTGLGLSVSYGIVKSHGGDIVVTSEPGRGSEFVVCLPPTG